MTERVFTLAGKRVWVAGHRGMVGSALMRRLKREECELLTVDRAELDLRRQADVQAWLAAERPEAVFLAAATVGGILANDTYPVDFLYDNLAIAANVIDAAHKCGVRKLLYFASSCVYPRLARQPMAEDALLSGPLEPTNEWYAVAKIAGIRLCQAYRRQHGSDFIAAMPCNLYGPGDNYDPETSHVVAALLAKTHAARVTGRSAVEIWGTGKPRREFLFVDDLADAAVFVIERYAEERHINIGYGADMTIAELARTIAEVVGYSGGFRFDPAKPDGTPRKLLDCARLNALGWRPRTDFLDGLRQAYDWYLENVAQAA